MQRVPLTCQEEIFPDPADTVSLWNQARVGLAFLTQESLQPTDFYRNNPIVGKQQLPAGIFKQAASGRKSLHEQELP